MDVYGAVGVVGSSAPTPANGTSGTSGAETGTFADTLAGVVQLGSCRKSSRNAGLSASLASAADVPGWYSGEGCGCATYAPLGVPHCTHDVTTSSVSQPDVTAFALLS